MPTSRCHAELVAAFRCKPSSHDYSSTMTHSSSDHAHTITDLLTPTLRWQKSPEEPTTRPHHTEKSHSHTWSWYSLQKKKTFPCAHCRVKWLQPTRFKTRSRLSKTLYTCSVVLSSAIAIAIRYSVVRQIGFGFESQTPAQQRAPLKPNSSPLIGSGDDRQIEPAQWLLQERQRR